MSDQSEMTLLSEFLLQLYQDIDSLPPETFKKNTLSNLKQLFSFDFAAWGGGAEMERTIGNVTIFNQSPELFTDWVGFANHDSYCDVAIQNLNCAVMFDDLPGFRNSSVFNEHWRRFDAQNMLATIVAEPFDNYVSFLGICNADRKHEFSERDRWMKELIMPHMANALRKNYRCSIAHEAKPGIGAALVDKTGVVLAAQGDFDVLLREEWGSETGNLLCHILPLERKKKRWLGRSISLDVEPLGSCHFVLKARPRGPEDKLSPRVMEVAQLYAKGLSYKEIAQALGIAPATARNHIAKVYNCLSVSSKAELATELSSSA